MSGKLYFYPVWVRLWHLLNALFFLLLIITGLSMQYSDPQSPFIRFDIAVKLHDIAGLGVTFNYLIFFFGNVFTPNGRYYRYRRADFGNIFKPIIAQARYYAFGLFKKAPHPFPLNEDRKFNPLQKLTYIIAMYVGMPIMIITGLALFFPKIFNLLGLGSLIVMDLVHVIMGIVMTIFMVIHLYICTLGHTPLSNFKSMATGWHEAHD